MGMQKPQAFYRTVLWDAAEINMLVHHPIATGEKEEVSRWGWPDERDSWTWRVPDGTPMTVRVFSKCSTKSMPGPGEVGVVKLTLNGADVPGSPMNISGATEFMATFTVPFAKGTLAAACTNIPDPVTTTLVTAGVAVALNASVDRSSLAASRDDLAYVVVSVVDGSGERIPDARERLGFAVSGVGELAAVGTGDPTDVSSFHQGSRVTYQGRVVAILRPAIGTPSGDITLTVTALDAKGIKPTTVTVHVG
jgi:beta-galactosidase